MVTEYITMSQDHIDWDGIRRAGEILRGGGLVAFPTETVYGLGGDALNPESSKKIYAAKGRPSDNPLIVHICRLSDLPRIVTEVPDDALKLAAAFWPGPMTMIFHKSDVVPRETTGGLDTVAVRFPSDPIAHAMIDAGGGYIAAPSANRSKRPSCVTGEHCREDLDGLVDMIIDGGLVGIGLESTIIDLTVSPPMILRPGYITQEMLEKVIGQVEVDRTVLDADSKEAPKAPGMKYKHYAPRGELTIVQGEPQKVADYINRQLAQYKRAGKKTGVLCTEESRALYDTSVIDAVKSVGTRKDYDTIARDLFLRLREFDDENVEVMYTESFAGPGICMAIMNRLTKAASQRLIKV